MISNVKPAKRFAVRSRGNSALRIYTHFTGTLSASKQMPLLHLPLLPPCRPYSTTWNVTRFTFRLVRLHSVSSLNIPSKEPPILRFFSSLDGSKTTVNLAPEEGGGRGWEFERSEERGKEVRGGNQEEGSETSSKTFERRRA